MGKRATQILQGISTGLDTGARTFEATRALFQDRADRQAAQKALEAISQQEMAISNEEQLAFEKFDQLQTKLQQGENVDPRAHSAAMMGVVMSRIKGASAKQQLYMRAIAANPANKYIQQAMVAQVESNMEGVRQMNQAMATITAAETQMSVSRDATERSNTAAGAKLGAAEISAESKRSLEILKHRMRSAEMLKEYQLKGELEDRKQSAKGETPVGPLGLKPKDWLRGAENAFYDARQFVAESYTDDELRQEAARQTGKALSEDTANEGQEVLTNADVSRVKKGLIAYHQQEIMVKNGLMDPQMVEHVDATGANENEDNDAEIDPNSTPSPNLPRAPYQGEQPVPEGSRRPITGPPETNAKMESWFEFWRNLGADPPPIELLEDEEPETEDAFPEE